MDGGTAMDGPVSAMGTRTKENTNSINVMAVVSTSGTMDGSTMVAFPKTSAMDTASLLGRTGPSTMANLSMANEKDKANTPLRMEDSTKGRGRMDDTMDLGLVPGRMDDGTGGNGETAWRMALDGNLSQWERATRRAMDGR